MRDALTRELFDMVETAECGADAAAISMLLESGAWS